MRKLVLFMTLACLLSAVACTTTNAPHAPLRVASLKGATSMGLVHLMKENETKVDGRYNFTIATAADDLITELIQGELDFAVIPANLASILYNKTKGKIRVVALTVGGVLNLVAKGAPLASIRDLKSQTILATGKGTVPEYILEHLLLENGISTNDLTIEWKSEPTEIVPYLKRADRAFAMLPEPFSTVAAGQVPGLHVLPLATVWEAVHQGGSQVTGVLVGRSDVLDTRVEEIKSFLADYAESVAQTTKDPKSTAALIEEYGIVKAEVAEKALPLSGLMFVTGEEMKQDLAQYLTILFEANPDSIGGTLPDDDFYAIGAGE